MLTRQLTDADNIRSLALRKDSIEDQIQTIGKSVSKLVALYANLDEDDFGANEIKKQLRELQARQKSMRAALQEVETGIVASRQGSFKAANIRAICDNIQTALKNATFDEWQSLFSEFGLQLLLYPSGEHVMKINLDVEPSDEIAAHPPPSTGEGVFVSFFI